MFDPFDTGSNPFINVFEGGQARAFAGREDQMRRQEEALKRARKRKTELRDNEFKHAEDMAKKYKRPFKEGRDWAGSAANALTTGIQVAKESGLFNRPNNNNNSFNLDVINRLGNNSGFNQYTQGIGTPSSWGFDASKAFNP